MINLHERNPNDERQTGLNQRSAAIKTRVAIPGIVRSFNAEEQTVTVQPSLREKLNIRGNEQWVEIPLLVDVPVVLPRAGEYVLTLPVQPGDECLVVFGDMCIDAWWQSGGVQNQIDCRRHDLSDGFALLGCWSQPRVIKNYSTVAAQLRTESGSAYIELSGSRINIIGSSININSGGNTVIDGKNFLGHKHDGVQTGGGNTGGVV